MTGWEAVTPETKEENATMRLTVPGGWIYRYGREMLFVPEPMFRVGRYFADYSQITPEILK